MSWEIEYKPNTYDQSFVEKLKDERVMLVGGAGFIGHQLALDLRSIGVATMVVDNLMWNSLIDNLYSVDRDPVQFQAYEGFLLDRFRLMRDAGVKLFNADARVLLDLTRAAREFSPTKIVHLSAISSAVEARKNPGLCFDLQLVTLRNILEIARENDKHVNQVMTLSSSTVYGDFDTPTVDESTRPRPQGMYANTKYMAERLVRTYMRQHGIGCTIIRPSALYGERCISRRVSQIFIENALRGKPLFLEGGGDGRLDFTYIKDLINGMVRALANSMDRGPGKSDTFNLTFGNARTIADLAGIVKSVVPSAILEERPRAEDKPIRGTLATDHALEVLGFKAEWSLDDGYKQYCEWYADQWARAKKKVEA